MRYQIQIKNLFSWWCHRFCKFVVHRVDQWPPFIFLTLGCGRNIGKTGFILPEIGFDLKEFIDPIPHRRTHTLAHTLTQIYTRKQLRLSLSKHKLNEFSTFISESCTFARKHLASIVHAERKIYKIKATNTARCIGSNWTELNWTVCVRVRVWVLICFCRSKSMAVMVRLVGKRSER